MSGHSARLLVSHRRLLWRVTRNELAARYAGSLLGMGWIVLYPLVILAIYAVVYLYIFRVRVDGLSSAQYVLYVFSGLVPFLMTAEALSLGVGSVVASKFLLNTTVFPLDLAPPKAVLMSQGVMAVGLGVIILGGFATGTLGWTVVLLPVLWGLLVMALIGVAWIASLVNVIFRDLQNLIGLLLITIMVASPIGYTPEMVPRALKPLLVINPFAYFVTAYQEILVLGRVPSLSHSMVIVLMSVGVFLLGGWLFGGTKRAVTDYV